MAHGFLHAVAMCVKHCALYTRVARCVAFHVIESVLYGALWQGRESLWTERFCLTLVCSHGPSSVHVRFVERSFLYDFLLPCVVSRILLKRRDGVECQSHKD